MNTIGFEDEIAINKLAASDSDTANDFFWDQDDPKLKERADALAKQAADVFALNPEHPFRELYEKMLAERDDAELAATYAPFLFLLKAEKAKLHQPPSLGKQSLMRFFSPRSARNIESEPFDDFDYNKAEDVIYVSSAGVKIIASMAARLNAGHELEDVRARGFTMVKALVDGLADRTNDGRIENAEAYHARSLLNELVGTIDRLITKAQAYHDAQNTLSD
jgi:hypothetical protein